VLNDYIAKLKTADFTKARWYSPNFLDTFHSAV